MDGPLSTNELIDLMTRAKAGDKAAFEVVYKHCFTPIFRYLLKRVHETSTAEDLTQTVFIKVYTSTTLFTNQTITPLAYLFTIARNTLTDHWRKNMKTPLVALDTELARTDQTNNIMEQLTRESEIQTCLETLATEARQVLELKFLSGLTTGEVAQKLGKNVAAIRQIQCRALRQIRERIKKEGRAPSLNN